MKRTRKLAMKKRETQAQRAVSFSKRRHGLFKKAAELCMLSGSRVAVIVSSPTSKQNLYCFGHPSVEAVLDAFLHDRVPEAVATETMDSAIYLYNAVKDLEGELEKRTGKNTSDGVWKSFEFDHDQFEVVLGRCKSISGLQLVVKEMEKLKEQAVKILNESLDSAKLQDDDDLRAVTKFFFNDQHQHGIRKFENQVKEKSIVVSSDDLYNHCLTSQDVKEDAFSFENNSSTMVLNVQDAFSSNSLTMDPAPDGCYCINSNIQPHETTSASTATASCANSLDELLLQL